MNKVYQNNQKARYYGRNLDLSTLPEEERLLYLERREKHRKLGDKYKDPAKEPNRAPKSRVNMTPEELTQHKREIVNRSVKKKYAKIKEDPEAWAEHQAKQKAWIVANPTYHSERSSRLITEDINFKLRKNLRTRINGAVGRKKMGSAVRDLGCTVEELRAHLETQFTEGMSWDNYGCGPTNARRLIYIEIDHIIPLASFDLTDREQFLKACHYSNLQPLWHVENRRKSDLVVVGGVTVRGRHLRNLKSTQTKNDNDNAKDIPCLTKSK